MSIMSLLTNLPSPTQLTGITGNVTTSMNVSVTGLCNIDLSSISSISSKLTFNFPDPSSIITTDSLSLGNLLQNIPDTSKFVGPLSSILDAIKGLSSISSIKTDIDSVIQSIQAAMENGGSDPLKFISAIVAPFDQIQKLFGKESFGAIINSLLKLSGVNVPQADLADAFKKLTGSFDGIINGKVTSSLKCVLPLVSLSSFGSRLCTWGTATGKEFFLDKFTIGYNNLSAGFKIGSADIADAIKSVNWSDAGEVASISQAINTCINGLVEFCETSTRTFTVIGNTASAFTADACKNKIEAILLPLKDLDISAVRTLAFDLKKMLDSLVETTKSDPAPVSLDSLKSGIKKAIATCIDQINEWDLSKISGGIDTTLAPLFDNFKAIEEIQKSISTEIGGFFSTIEEKLSSIDLSRITNLYKEALSPVDSVVTTLETELTTALNTVTGALNDIKTNLDSLMSSLSDPTTGLKEQIKSLLKIIKDLVDKIDLQPVIDKVKDVADSVTSLDFDEIVNPVIDGMGSVKDQLSQISFPSLPDPVQSLLNEGLNVIKGYDFNGNVTSAIISEFEKLEKALKESGIDAIGKALKEAVALIDKFNPVPMAVDAIKGAAYTPLIEALDKVKPSQALAPLGEKYQSALSSLDAYKPSVLLKPVTDSISQIKSGFGALQPSQLIAPLKSVTDEIKNSVTGVFKVSDWKSQTDSILSNVRTPLNSFTIDPYLATVQSYYDQVNGFANSITPELLSHAVARILNAILGRMGIPVDPSGLGSLIKSLNSSATRSFADELFTPALTSLQSLKNSLKEAGVQQSATEVRTKWEALKNALSADFGSGESTIAPLRTALNNVDISSHIGGCVSAYIRAAGSIDNAISAIGTAKNTAQSLLVSADKVRSTIADVLKEFSCIPTLLTTVAKKLFPGIQVDSVTALIKNLLLQINPSDYADDIKNLINALLGSLKNLVSTNGIPSLLEHLVQSILDKINIINLDFIEKEIDTLYTALQTKLSQIDPATLISGMDTEYNKVITLLKKIDPVTIGAPLDSLVNSTLKPVCEALDPEKLLLPELDQLFKEIENKIGSLDLNCLFQPLLDALDIIKDKLGVDINKAADAFKDMVSAIHFGSSQAEVSAEM